MNWLSERHHKKGNDVPSRRKDNHRNNQALEGKDLDDKETKKLMLPDLNERFGFPVAQSSFVELFQDMFLHQNVSGHVCGRKRTM
ncbi:uncharacterized protein N7469_000892 [Penicillium citrinum]|uniref:Uncharacterized protein n=2 Tax=Penicillium TaxID=5073 RepID=A0A9W9PDS7_PENCI|nr:uncharacterized protein N7469_000892 [Penicillium citrinum]KAJ5242565.1 hypothetical protein N7469_000892 [Penicillium citrinum]KAJ5599931.1 hypothetical protein N7450_000998 [Penicillium hetheringtonii]